MSLNPAEMPLLRVAHKLNIPNDPGYSVMVWYKTASPGVSKVPILDATWGNEVNFAWHMWIYPDPTNLYLYSPTLAIRGESLINVMDWNLLTMRVQGGAISLELNGKLAGTMNVDKNNAKFGDELLIGRRQLASDSPSDPSATSNMPFNGCMAHVMAFNKVLSPEEMVFYANLVKDNSF